jgi:hypothetical protein
MMSNNNTSLTLSRLPELAATKSIDAATAYRRDGVPRQIRGFT